eukprot:g11043.t1
MPATPTPNGERDPQYAPAAAHEISSRPTPSSCTGCTGGHAEVQEPVQMLPEGAPHPQIGHLILPSVDKSFKMNTSLEVGRAAARPRGQSQRNTAPGEPQERVSVTVRNSMSGEAARTIEVPGKVSERELRGLIEAALGVPASEQKLLTSNVHGDCVASCCADLRPISCGVPKPEDPKAAFQVDVVLQELGRRPARATLEVTGETLVSTVMRNALRRFNPVEEGRGPFAGGRTYVQETWPRPMHQRDEMILLGTYSLEKQVGDFRGSVPLPQMIATKQGTVESRGSGSGMAQWRQAQLRDYGICGGDELVLRRGAGAAGDCCVTVVNGRRARKATMKIHFHHGN